jgi:hypothetical protein
MKGSRRFRDLRQLRFEFPRLDGRFERDQQDIRGDQLLARDLRPALGIFFLLEEARKLGVSRLDHLFPALLIYHEVNAT